MSERPFTAKDARDLAGLSYRQLNDWEERGALPGDEGERDGGWRRFTPKQIFALMVCGEIRRLYGTPVERLRFVRECMMGDGTDHLAAAIRLMQAGLHVFLLTDLEETFVMDSDLEFKDLMRDGFFRVDIVRPFHFLRLNHLVNNLLSALKEPIQLQPHDAVYRLAAEAQAAISCHTGPELDLLQAVRSGRFDRIEVLASNGQIRALEAEGDVDHAELDIHDDKVAVTRHAEFETFSFTSCDGRVVRARRKLPKRYSAADNEPFLFARRERESLPDSRDGQKPSGEGESDTSTRSDGKNPSFRNHPARTRAARAPDAQSGKVPRGSR